MYQKQFQVLWADLDPNMHMRHTAYNDYAAQVRLSFFVDNGLSPQELQAMQLGPILFREETKFLKEVRMNEIITVDCRLAGMRKDGSRWKIVHQLFKQDNTLAAIITVEGAWLDLTARKLTIPGSQILKMFDNLERLDDFEYYPDKSH